MKKIPGNLNALSPAHYRISVIGYLDENMSDRLGGLTIQNSDIDNTAGKHMVTLTGKVSDQAALLGVLNALYSMRMPLIEVECLGDTK